MVWSLSAGEDLLTSTGAGESLNNDEPACGG